jgi:CRP/FNR family transcriptional regulator, cyclic AMP receptor protein
VPTPDISTLLADHVDRLSLRLVEALYVSAERRVPRRLLDLRAIYGNASGDPVTIPPTQVEFADLRGDHPSTCMREMSDHEAVGART